jgi:hypothetical protein
LRSSSSSEDSSSANATLVGRNPARSSEPSGAESLPARQEAPLPLVGSHSGVTGWAQTATSSASQGLRALATEQARMPSESSEGAAVRRCRSREAPHPVGGHAFGHGTRCSQREQGMHRLRCVGRYSRPTRAPPQPLELGGVREHSDRHRSAPRGKPRPSGPKVRALATTRWTGAPPRRDPSDGSPGSSNRTPRSAVCGPTQATLRGAHALGKPTKGQEAHLARGAAGTASGAPLEERASAPLRGRLECSSRVHNIKKATALVTGCGCRRRQTSKGPNRVAGAASRKPKGGNLSRMQRAETRRTPEPAAGCNKPAEPARSKPPRW